MKDINLIKEIFADKLYLSPIIFKEKISKISDKRLVNGLTVELVARSITYELGFSDLNILFDYRDDFEDLLEDHNYYVDFLSQCPKIKFFDFLISRDIAYCEEFSSWIKTLSKEKIKEVIDYCIELEIYEAIGLIQNLSK